jgi:4-amino-4-deoxy-L-arabinose transferase-like glycosyltransferase
MALEFYRTGGADRTAAENVMRYYGALHALVGAGFERLFAGLHWVAARHLASVLFASIGFTFSVLLARSLGGRWAGAVAALLLLALPRWTGDAMFNPIDVPTAGMFMAAFYFLVRLARELESARLRLWLAFGVAAGLTLAVRLVGILLVPFAAAVVASWVLVHVREPARVRQCLPRLVLGLALASVACVAVSFALWPRMLVEPLTGLADSLARTNRYPWPGNVFHGGVFIPATEIPRSYLADWFFLTTPPVTLVGLLLAFACGARASRPFGARLPCAVALVLPLAFPPFYAAWSHAVLYDGLRHFLFLLPPLAALAAVGWSGALLWLARWRAGLAGGVLALGALAFEPLAWTARHLPYTYTYFQPLAGGLARASHAYESDYWALSLRAAAEWIVAHRAELVRGDEKLRVLTSTSWHLLAPWLDEPARYEAVPSNQEPFHLLLVHTRFQKPGWESKLEAEASLGIVPEQIPFWAVYRGGLAAPAR